ncbi:MAG: prolyl oligopeptidase family serine peptidase [Planctomycetota bacterium]|nr:prolyl oligopeptidase family serine peptidase [Planctomycetota bacterium]
MNRYPRMLHDWYVDQVQAAAVRHTQAIDSLQSKEDALRYVSDVQRKIRQCFGPEPERTPLNARVTGTLERDGYRIEKVIFDSRPNFPVTANLYIPTIGSGPYPAVVGTCGHSFNGKAAEAYQSFAQGLVRLGHVCLIFDPIGQGERIQYTKDQVKSELGAGVNEHLHAGNQQFLVGDFLGSWMAWDGIRALDYLLTRGEVDPKQIGVTGNSGGGTTTTWMCGLDSRWSMAAPACFVTSFRNNLENELPADTEQCPPRALALGLDHCDFLAALAPKPIIILAKEQDYFDVRGAEQAYQKLKKLYGLLGLEQNIALFIGPTTHGYSQENREAMYSWFHNATQTVLKESDRQPTLGGVLTTNTTLIPVREPRLTIEKDEDLWCSPTGQVAAMKGTTTVFQATAAKAAKLSSQRRALSEDELGDAVRYVLKLPPIPATTPEYRIWQHKQVRDYPTKYAIGYAVVTEPGIEAIVYQLTSEQRYSRPRPGTSQAILYLADLSSDEELRSEKMLREWAKEKSMDLFACDLRGCGESQPDTCGPKSFLKPYGSEYFYAIHGLMLDRPLLGQKTWDVLRVLQWMESAGYQQVHLAARGRGTLPATFAGLLSNVVNQITLKQSLDSFSTIAQTEYYQAPLVSILPNVLSYFDLPECYRALQNKQLIRST